MINLDKFIKGKVAYIIDYNNVMDFLETVENTTPLMWRSGSKPTEYIPPTRNLKILKALVDSDVRISIGVGKNHIGRPCLEYTLDPQFTIDSENIEVY